MVLITKQRSLLILQCWESHISRGVFIALC